MTVHTPISGTLQRCPRCRKRWEWVLVEIHGGGDKNAPITTRYELAECTRCGVLIEAPLNPDPDPEENEGAPT